MRKGLGMTLLETLIAMIIITVIAISGSAYFAFCKRSIINSQSRLMAVNFARDSMERLYMQPSLVPGNNYNDYNDLTPGDFRDRDGGTCSYNVSAPSGGYQIVTVTVNSNR